MFALSGEIMVLITPAKYKIMYQYYHINQNDAILLIIPSICD